MDLTLLIILLVVLMGAVGVVVIYLTVGDAKSGTTPQRSMAVSESLRSLVTAQREQQEGQSSTARQNLALAAAAESETKRKKASGSRMTLEKRLRYGHWVLSPVQFRAIQLCLAFSGLAVALFYAFTAALTALFTAMPWLLFDGLLERSINKRFKAFDDDYPVFLMQYVSLLKTGMGTIGGLEAASKGLDPDSLVRIEIELLVERLKLGLTEEQAISAFGEDVAHPELELFVQGLLLSRKVGGTLSHTLERLAKQVRKRQQFRQQAVSAVGLERGSVYAVTVIMTLLLFYILWVQPDLILPAFSDPSGMKAVQFGFTGIIFGWYWSRVITNIKV